MTKNLMCLPSNAVTMKPLNPFTLIIIGVILIIGFFIRTGLLGSKHVLIERLIIAVGFVLLLAGVIWYVLD